jgi:nitrite reductase/ring-hydroxylating ferredoxin subunit
MGPVVTTSDGTSSSPADANTGEVFDLNAGTSVSAGQMVGVRYVALGARLLDGTVLVVGNASDPRGLVETPVAELYDPATNSFRRTGDRTVTEQPVALFPMDDGRVLLFGLHPEIFDPTTGTFTATATPAADQPTSAVMLEDGTVLSIQGYCSEVHSLDSDGLSEGHPPVHTERFDPRTGEFMPGPDLPHCVTTAATMPDGNVFLAGYWWSNTGGSLVTPSGNDDEQTWSGVLDLATGATTITPNPTRRNPTAVVTADDRVLLIAGVGLLDGALTWADVYP